MKRREFLGLLGLIGCENMFLPQHGYLGGPDKMATILIIGDSVARGNSTDEGTTPGYNTVFQWDDGNSNLRMITNADLLEPVAASAVGSQWPQFGDSYYKFSGKKPVLINCAIGGASWWDDTPGFSWYTNDDLYDDAVTKTNNCLAFLGRSTVDIVYINLGINDSAQQSYSLDIAFLTSLIDRINSDFDSPRICISMPGKINTSTLTELTRINTMRKYIKSLSFTYSNVEIAGSSPHNFAAWSAVSFFADDYHLNVTGNNLYGDKLARQLAIPTSKHHKYTRSIIGSLYDNPSETRRGYIDTFITGLDNDNLLEEIDALYIFSDMNNNENNGYIDWAFRTPSAPVTGGGSAVDMQLDEMGLDGLNSLSAGQISVMADKAVIASDFIWGAYTGTYNDIAAGTTATLMGGRESASGGIFLVRQTSSSNIQMFGGGTTAVSDATDTKFQNNTHYAVVRDAGNVRFVKGTSIVTSSAIASVAPGATLIRGYRVGGYANNGTVADFLDAGIKAHYLAKYSTWSISNFDTHLTSFLTNWHQAIL